MGSNKQVQRLSRIARKSAEVIKTDGVTGFVKRGAKHVVYRKILKRPGGHLRVLEIKDVLFIDGTNMDFLIRYRVDHLMEQLRANGMTSDKVYAGALDVSMVRRYSGFVFYRCVPNDTIREFVRLAKFFNKTCFFSIDDLVIDTEYTDTIKAVQDMPLEQRELYDSGVRGYGDMMRMCRYGITTTKPLAQEMKKKGKGKLDEVHINRNVMSQEMVSLSDAAVKAVQRDSSRIVMGYFSGSDTHNADFQMIMPALQKIMSKHPNVYVKLVGRITPPKGLEEYEDRLLYVPFMDWKLLPREIRSCDINLSPLAEDSIFNRAKSENKWSEAALVKTVTVASNVGAFKTEIENGVTGVLVENDGWYKGLHELVADADKRKAIAESAYHEVRENRTTLDHGGRELVRFLRSNMAENVKVVTPSIDISGGVNVIFKHAEILRKNGYDVTLISTGKLHDSTRLRKLSETNIIVDTASTRVTQVVDKIVATHWSTVAYAREYPNVTKRYYLVQGLESRIYDPGTDARLDANATYSDETGMQYITISQWCADWLEQWFGKKSRLATNGIDLKLFPQTVRNIEAGRKIKILIEGNHKDTLKNVDEAFMIIDKLDSAQYEVSYLSYNAEHKDWYRVDHSYNKIEPEQVGKIYSEHDILLKTSLLESFSYPPLEMMATGGYSVAIQNEGNREFLIDGYNALTYEAGDIDSAVEKIHAIVNDKALRNKLRKNGTATAARYDWSTIENKILDLYK